MKKSLAFTSVLLALSGIMQATAAVSPQEAMKLKTELTPFGAERAGNKDGTIPAWTGGYTTAIPGEVRGGRRGDPFKGETPLLTITAKNADSYADKLTDGTRAMLKKYPDTFYVNVFKTHRTETAPDWVYQDTFKNATSAHIDNDVLQGAYGGVPFPIPKAGEEVMWNHVLRWTGDSVLYLADWYTLTADGHAVLVSDTTNDQQFPYYYKDGTVSSFAESDDAYWLVKIVNSGPPIRAGQALLAKLNTDYHKLATWVYLTGQRRVRRLPNACCDSPTPAAAGLMSFDEIDTFTGQLTRFNWTIIGKKEMYIPYNANSFLQPTSDAEVLSPHHYNPKYMRWELHRVWVVEANLRPGQRHQAPRSRYYCDEDSWICVLADRWDQNGQLWKTLWSQVFVADDMPGLMIGSFGFNDLISGTGFVGYLLNSKSAQAPMEPRRPESYYSSEILASDSLR